MEPRFEFPFERAAMRGEVPADLDLIDAGACYRLVEIYKAFYAAGKTDEARRRARMEKEALRRDWEFSRKLDAQRIRIWKETERLRAAIRKNPTKENAIALCDAIVGITVRDE